MSGSQAAQKQSFDGDAGVAAAVNHQQSGEKPAILDCFACRLVGTAAFGGIGLYAVAMARYYGNNKHLSAGPGAILGIRLVGYGARALFSTDGREAALRQHAQAFWPQQR